MMNAYLKGQEVSNNLTLHPKKLEEEEIKPKLRRKEINEIETER